MTRLTEREAETYKLVLQGIGPKEIGKITGRPRVSVNATIRRLVDRKVIRRVDIGVYEAVVTEFVVSGEPVVRKAREELPEKPKPLTIDPAVADQIRQHYGRVPRREIARILGIDKVTLNLMIEQLRLRKGG